MRTSVFALAATVAAAYEGDVIPMFGGEKVSTTGSFPWIVALLDEALGPDDDSACAGSLIEKDLVVTASHCARSTVAQLGGMGEKFAVIDIYQHPTVDVAILKLEAPPPSSSFAPRRSSAPEPGTEADHFGWGRPSDEEYGREIGSGMTLCHATVPVVSDEACEPTFDRMLFDNLPVDPATQLCASAADQSHFASVNSGGPLVVDGQLVGLASRGPSNYHGHYVFVDLFAVQDFVEDVIEREQWLSLPQDTILPPVDVAPRSNVMHLDDDDDNTVSLLTFKRKGSCASTTSVSDKVKGTYSNVTSGSFCWQTCAENIPGGENSLVAVNYDEDDGTCHCRDECRCIDTDSKASLLMRSDEVVPELCGGQARFEDEEKTNGGDEQGQITFVRAPRGSPVAHDDDDRAAALFAHTSVGSCAPTVNGEMSSSFDNATSIAECWATCAENFAGGENSLFAVNFDEDDGLCQCHEECACVVDANSKSTLVLRSEDAVPEVCQERDEEQPLFPEEEEEEEEEKTKGEEQEKPRESQVMHMDDDDNDEAVSLIAFKKKGSCAWEILGGDEIHRVVPNVRSASMCWETCADGTPGGDSNLYAVSYEEEDGTCRCHDECRCLNLDSDATLVLRSDDEFPEACENKSLLRFIPVR